MHSTRERVARLAVTDSGEVAVHARRAVAALEGVSPHEATDRRELSAAGIGPSLVNGESPGFVFSPIRSVCRRALRSRDRIELTDEIGSPSGASPRGLPFSRLRSQAMLEAARLGLAPVAVTVLFEQAGGEYLDISITNDVVRWVGEQNGEFRPDVEGRSRSDGYHAARMWHDGSHGWRLDEFFDDGSEVGDRWLCWQIGWTVSRGGFRGLPRAFTRTSSPSILRNR